MEGKPFAASPPHYVNGVLLIPDTLYLTASIHLWMNTIQISKTGELNTAIITLVTYHSRYYCGKM
jgi:hypothetical protein